jgi:hypothetical protein
VSDLAVREPLDLLVSLEREGKATPTSLRLGDELEYDTYEALGCYLGALRDATAWWIGDWLLFGEGRYGEKYADAVEATGRSKQTLKNYAWVAQNVPTSRRRARLSWSHHEAIAKLGPREQKAWLDRAERERWSVEEFRGMLRDPEPIEAHVVPQPVVITSAEAREIVGVVGSWVGGDRDPGALAVLAAVERISAAALNGRVAVVVTDGEPCPTCGGSGRAADE